MSTARTTRLSRCRRTSVRLLSASGAASVVVASVLLGALDFALVKATTTPRRVEPFGLLEGLPGEAVAQAREWERHLGLVPQVQGPPASAPDRARLQEIAMITRTDDARPSGSCWPAAGQRDEPVPSISGRDRLVLARLRAGTSLTARLRAGGQP